MTVNLYYRKPNESHKSIELIFSGIARALRSQITINEKTSPFPSLGFLRRWKAVVWAYNQREPCDLHHVTGDIHFLVFGLPRKKTILTIHDLTFLKKGNFLSRFILWLFWVYLPVWWVKKVTCVSETTKKDIVKYAFCDQDKVNVIPNFVNDGFKQDEKKFNEMCPVILQVGTAYNKNIDRLTEAVKGMNCELRIIGHMSETQHGLMKANKIRYSNAFDLRNDELVNEYRKCDILAFCSTAEGFGLPIIEAQTVGRVVLTSNLSSMPEVAGDGACFVDPFDTMSITSGMRNVIEDKPYREALIDKGFVNAKKFEIAEAARKYLELYNSILSN